MEKRIYRRTWSSRAVATAAESIALMIASNGSPSQAFQPIIPISTAKPMYAAMDFSRSVVPATTMRCGPSPWEPDCGGFGSFHRTTGGHQPRRGRTLASRIFSPPSVFQDPGLQIMDPELVNTDSSYQLTFSLPADVAQDGFDVSVSGSLLTVRAEVTHENSGGAVRRGGWVTRSTRTDSLSRSFVLPEDVSSSSITTAWVSDGKVQVKFSKTKKPSNFTDEQAAAVSAHRSKISSDKAPPSSTSAQYLSSLSTPEPATDPKVDSREEPSQNPAAPDTAPSPWAERPSRARSVFDAMDQELGELTRAVWGNDALKFPTQEEMAKRVEAAREARARRVMAMWRATMAVNVSETEGGEYLIKVALPEGATRDDVSLAILPYNALRAKFARDGRRPVYKDVPLPNDAVLSDISAKFEPEKAEKTEKTDGTPVEGGGGVSGLDITVRRSVPSEPKHINIF